MSSDKAHGSVNGYSIISEPIDMLVLFANIEQFNKSRIFCTHTVNPKIFARILISRITLKYI